MNHGHVYLIGAGPGDPGLLTVRGQALLRAAEVLVYDRLVSAVLINEAPADCTLIDVGKTPGTQNVPQDDINALLIEHARAGRTVVRLKGGDPYLFGRGHEEAIALRAAGLSCTVIPGITSAFAAPASAGIPPTARRTARSVAVVTASTEDGVDVLDYGALARMDTVIVLMGRGRLHEVAARLVAAGRSADTPACCIARGTWPSAAQVTAPLGEIDARATAAGLTAPAITVIGTVADQAASGAPVVEGLYGRRIVLTRPAGSGSTLRDALQAAGAHVLHCPLIDIVHTHPAELGAALARSESFGWLAVTSRNAVEAVWRALEHSGSDARHLAGCRIAAVGPGTARALARRGLRPDLVPDVYTADGLAAALSSTDDTAPVLYPHSSRSDRALIDALTRAGRPVESIAAYDTRTCAWTATQRAAVAEGSDAICLYSPSAVAGLIEQDMPFDAALACVGPTTAAAVRSAGREVDIVADPHDDAGMFNALMRYFTQDR